MGGPCHRQKQCSELREAKSLNIQKLLGLEYEPVLVDLMFSEKSEVEIKRIFLLGLIKESELDHFQSNDTSASSVLLQDDPSNV